VGAELS